jgi:hypothetical protein
MSFFSDAISKFQIGESSDIPGKATPGVCLLCVNQHHQAALQILHTAFGIFSDSVF